MSKSKLEEAIEAAARDLPEGYQIEITVEKGWAGARLSHPDTFVTEADDQKDCLALQIQSLLKIAQKEPGEIRYSLKVGERWVRRCVPAGGFYLTHFCPVLDEQLTEAEVEQARKRWPTARVVKSEFVK